MLLNVRGTLGGVYSVPTELARFNVSREIAVISAEPLWDPSFLAKCLASPQLEAWFAARLRGVAYTGINLATLNEAPIPLCSPAEQAEIVRILDARLDAADAFSAEIDASLKRADTLRQSILTEAFAGRLVPQDPEDVPATALLARIRAERDAAEPARRRKRKTPA